MFLFPFTRFEIPVYMQVRCDNRKEGLKYVRARKLNGCLTTRCKDEGEARKQLYDHIWKWFTESSDSEAGKLIYFKFEDE